MKDIKERKVWWVNPLTFFLLIIAITTMGIVMAITQDGDVLGPMSGSLVGVFGVYLGIDLSRMLRDTSQRPAGKYKNMNFGRYIFSTLSFFGLLIWAYIIHKQTLAPMTAAISIFGSGCLLMIGFIIGGIEANKLLTGREGE